MRRDLSISPLTSKSLGFVILFVYIAIYGIVLSARTVPFTGYETDGVYYMIQARTLFTHSFAPSTYGGGIGMPAAIFLLNRFVLDTFLAAKLVSGLAGLMLVLGAASIAVTLQGLRIAMATALLLLVNPLVLIYSTTSLSDVLGAALPILAVLCLLDDEKGYRVFLAGLCLGLAWSVRSINLVFLLLVFVIAWNHRADRRKTFVLLVWAAVGWLLGALPQLAINIHWFGNPFYSENWRNTAALVYDWERVNQLSSFSQVLQAAPFALFVAWFKQLVVQVPETLYHVAYLPLLLAFPGFVFLARRVEFRYRALVVLWGIACAFYLGMVAAVWRIELRYFIVVLPLILISAVVMWDVLAGHSKPVFIGGIVIAVALSGMAAFENTREMLAMQIPAFRQAGLYLKEHSQPNDKILAVQPHVLFYAERPGILFENLSAAELSDLPPAVQAHGIQWVVFDRAVGLPKFPALNRLLDTSASFGKGWKLEQMSENTSTVIWKMTQIENGKE